METVIRTFAEFPLLAIGAVLWAVLGLLTIGLMCGYYVMMERRKGVTSGIWGGGSGAAIAGVTAAVLILVLIPVLIVTIVRLSNSLSADLFAQVDPAMKAALLARTLSARMNADLLALIGELVLAVPAAVLVGLALTVPFRRQRRNLAESRGGES